MQVILTFDIEEYFQVENFADIIKREDWEKYESRVEMGTNAILDLLDKYNHKATFFVLGWIAERHPELIKKISDAGHEIGSHGYNHALVYEQTPDEFRADLLQSLDLLEKITGKRPRCYRAPSFSITKHSLWALDVLLESGIAIDSSIFPIIHDRYGITDCNPLPHIIREKDGTQLIEFPITTLAPFQGVGQDDNAEPLGPKNVAINKLRLPFSGGGYLRLLPRWLLRALIKSNLKSGKPVIVYTHPWEYDPDQPKIEGGSALSTFRHYVELKSTSKKLEAILSEFECCGIEEYITSYEGLR